MIKAKLTYHDPLDIYDHFKNSFGNLSMIIKGNDAIMTFQSNAIKKKILQNPRRIIKSLPLTVKPFQSIEVEKPVHQSNLYENNSLSNKMDIEENTTNAQQSLMLGDAIQLPNVGQRIKRIGVLYEAKIKQLKQMFMDQEICNSKITQFNNYLTNYLKRHQVQYFNPYKTLISVIKQYSGNNQNNVIDLEPVFTTTNLNNQRPMFFSSSPYFKQGLNYSNFDVQEVKRLCLLNENDFVATVKMNEKNSYLGQHFGQTRIYRKNQNAPKYTLDIPQGPYSLMTYDNFVLVGDFFGQIHSIDIENENACEFSNKLNNGLIVQMQEYSRKNVSSIITLLQGVRTDYKIKLFEVEKESISPQVNSLTFHPKEEMLCEGITMTVEVLQDGKFVYGCGRNTYICPLFDKSQRDYIIHEKNVMKIKKRNNHELIEAIQTKILLTDLRVTRIKNDIFQFNHDINTIEMLSEHYVFYGGKKGQIGVIDCRKPKCCVWTPFQPVHSGKISDILKMGTDVITCDNSGIICEWKKDQFK